MGILNPPVLASAIDREPYATIMSLDPVVYWPMDDASGALTNHGSLASKDATAYGSPTYGATGIVPRSGKGCIEFDGSTDYFQVTDAAISGTDQEFSFGLWVETNGGLSARTFFQQQDATDSYCGFRLYTNSGVLIFQSHHNDGSSQTLNVYGLAALQDNTPMYLGVTATATQFILYVEGFQFGTLNRTTVTYSAASDIFIGRAEGPYRYYIGKMSDLFIVPTALTASQHRDLARRAQVRVERPVGDHFKDARTLVLDAPAETFTSVGAESDPTVDPAWMGSIAIPRGVWIKFVPPELDGVYIINLDSTATSTATKANVYIGDVDQEVPDWNTYADVGDLYSSSSTGFDVLDRTLSEGECYYILAGVQKSYLFNPGPFDMWVESFPDPPANDNFANAQTIDVSTSGTLDGSTIGSTIEDSQESVRTNCNEHSVWYKFTADATGNITLSLGSTPNYKYYGIAVWDATADGISVIGDIDWTTPLAYDDNDATGNGEVTIAVTSGHVYYFHVTQYALMPSDDFTLDWTDIT